MKVVLDTNVVVSAALSRRGASSRLLGLLADGAFDIALSLPLYLEYEDVLSRDELVGQGVDPIAAKELHEDLGSIAHGQIIYFLWRPWLRDSKDDLVLEAAVASGSRYIVTHNVRDFIDQGIKDTFGIDVVTPQTLLKKLIRDEP